MSGPTTSETAAAAWYCPSCEREYPGPLPMCPNDGTRLVRVSDRDPLIGQTLDERYVIRERLGAGGMGVVYRAWQTSVGREVAVKVIRGRTGGSAALVKRFLREAKLSSQLAQPSTVTVIDFGQTDEGLLYLVMELLRGRTLAQVLEGGALSPERAVRIAMQICDALDAAHKAGIIHRDLKPANVMILDEPAGRDLTKVLDFGLAKAIDTDESSVTQSGRLVGTPSHLAPEVALGGDATAASDLYALGVMLYEMLAGHPPFSAGEVSTVLMMHAYHSVPALDDDVPPGLAAVVERTLAKQPERRPASAAALRELLEHVMAPDRAGPTQLARLPRKRSAPAADQTTATNQALLPAATGDRTPRASGEVVRGGWRRRAAIAVVALAAAAALAFALVRRGGGGGAGTGAGGASGRAVIDAGVEAPVDAAVAIDAGAAIDAPAAPVDAAAEDDDDPPIDAGRRARPDPRRDGTEPRRPIDAGVTAPPPIDAAGPNFIR